MSEKKEIAAMCEFFSYLEVSEGKKTYFLCLKDKDLFTADGRQTDRVKEMLEGSKDKDFIGHHATEAYWGKTGAHRETWKFWIPMELPEPLRPLFKDARVVIQNFGMMLREYLQASGRSYILREAPDSWQELKDFILEPRVAHLSKKVQTETLKLNVRNDSIANLVKLGKYQYANPNITDGNFPEASLTQGEQDAILLHFDEDVASEEVAAVADKLGYRLGTVKELLSLGIDHPGKQKEFPIVALGSRSQLDDDWLVPFLYGWRGLRGLDLCWWGGGWGGSCRFLAFPK